MKTHPPLLRLRNLHHSRGDEQRGFRLEVAELTIHAGEFVALVGPSGSGKSTLLDLLGLVLRPCGGDAFILHQQDGCTTDILGCWQSGNDTHLAHTRRHLLGYVLQTGGLLPYLDVADNINVPARFAGQQLPRKTINQQLKHFGLAGYGHKKPATLSGGERQRVAILRALAHRPALILADEPTAALDHLHARTVVEYFHTLAREQGSAIVMVTHDETLVRGIAQVMVRFVAKPKQTGTLCYHAVVEERS